jgi:hypothetical protein
MHNGWTNYETWAKEAELANNEALYNRAMKMVRAAIASSAPGSVAREVAIGALANTLRYNFAHSAAERKSVNWQEIAQTWIANLGG